MGFILKKVFIILAIIAYGMIAICAMNQISFGWSNETAGLYREIACFIFAIIIGITIIYSIWKFFLYLLFKVVYVISCAISMGKKEGNIDDDRGV